MSRDSLMVKRLKKNYTYSAKQLHEAFGVHSRTLSGWQCKGLILIKNRPLIVFSEDLREFLRQKVAQRKTKLQFTEFYCMSCKVAKQSCKGKVHIQPLNNILQVKAVCPDCGVFLNRRHNKKKYEDITPLMRAISLEDLHILQRTIRSEKTHLNEATNNTSSEPSTDCHLHKQENLI
mgnify:CR=1 FL=1